MVSRGQCAGIGELLFNGHSSHFTRWRVLEIYLKFTLWDRVREWPKGGSRGLSAALVTAITCCGNHQSGVDAAQAGRGSWTSRVAGQHWVPQCHWIERFTMVTLGHVTLPSILKDIKNGRQPTDQKRKITFSSFQYLGVNTLWQCILFPFSHINKIKFWN